VADFGVTGNELGDFKTSVDVSVPRTSLVVPSG
jgi:hypothetical protein